MKDRELFQNYMALLGESFEKTMSDLFIDAYWIALSKYSDEQCKVAFDMALVKCKWFPKPVELIEFIKYGEDGVGDVDLLGEIEADKVLSAIKKVGRYKSVCFDDPYTMSVIDKSFGGWVQICEMKENDEKWFRKDFVKSYRAYRKMDIKQFGHLVGWHEKSNEFRNFPNSPELKIEFVGDKPKALGVLRGKKDIKLIK